MVNKEFRDQHVFSRTNCLPSGRIVHLEGKDINFFADQQYDGSMYDDKDAYIRYVCRSQQIAEVRDHLGRCKA